MRFADMLLYPLAGIYDGLTAFRNRMFDVGLKKSINFEIPTVVVGNLAVGGTGKTPMVEWLIRKLKGKYQVAMLSRGYGRRSSGFQMAKPGVLPMDIGDEPYQVYDKFGPEVQVAVGEDRVLAVPMLLAQAPETEVILLDDAYQHRYLKGDLNILLTTYDRPFFSDRLLPAGRLRESRKNADRADILVITKCPEGLSEIEKAHFTAEAKKYTLRQIPVFFAGLSYDEAYPLNSSKNKLPKKVILVTGIVNPQPILKALEGICDVLELIRFPDHHRYSEKDLIEIKALANKFEKDNPAILTTEKDAVKLKDEKLLSILADLPVFVLPVQMKLEEADEAWIIGVIEEKIKLKGFAREI